MYMHTWTYMYSLFEQALHGRRLREFDTRVSRNRMVRYTYMYVYMYVCFYTHMYVTHELVSMDGQIYIYVCVYVFMYSHTYVCHP